MLARRAWLSGSGTVGAISGAGAIDPGNSPGILTAPPVDPAGGLRFNFEFSSLNPVFADASASVNDVLRLTEVLSPFSAPLTLSNVVNLYFNVEALQENEISRGAFFTDWNEGFDSLVGDAKFSYYLKDGAGTVIYGGEKYSALGSELSIVVSTQPERRFRQRHDQWADHAV